MIGRIGLAIVAFSAALFFVGCTGEQTQSGKQKQSGKQEPSSEAASEPTTEPTADQRKAGQANETEKEASSQPPEGRSPEEVLALQYEYINRGDFDKAYSLFAEQSQQEVSLAQYRAFFEDNAPYSVTDYSFSAPQAQEDSATLEAEFTANSASGTEQLQRTQRFVRETGEWRVVMRPDQVAAFTATSSPESGSKARAGQRSEKQSAPAEEVAQEDPNPNSSDGTLSDGTHRVGTDIQPGTYRTRDSKPGCYYERLAGFSGEFNELIANGVTDAPAIITIEPTDAGFRSQRCGTWTQDLSAITQSKTSFDEGAYIVGTDIEPGTYRSSGSSGCYYERLSGFTGGFENLIANGLSDTPTIVTIAPTDAGFQSQRCGTWTKTQ